MPATSRTWLIWAESNWCYYIRWKWAEMSDAELRHQQISHIVTSGERGLHLDKCLTFIKISENMKHFFHAILSIFWPQSCTYVSYCPLASISLHLQNNHHVKLSVMHPVMREYLWQWRLLCQAMTWYITSFDNRHGLGGGVITKVLRQEATNFSPITSVIDETFLHVMKYEKKLIITRPPLAAWNTLRHINWQNTQK